MSWFVCALLCTLGWGSADICYKLGADAEDRYSHLKTAVWVGLVMGVCALALLPFSESGMSFGAIAEKGVRYLPASLCYIISMVIGYAGLKYLELSVASPVQNASGGLSMLLMLAVFSLAGRGAELTGEWTALDLIGMLLIIAGVPALAVAEQRLSRQEAPLHPGERKYRYGALALLFPLLYCLFDTLGTAADGIILDENMGLGLGEIDVIILYGLTFLLAGIIAWLYMYLRAGIRYNPFGKGQRSRGLAAVFEEIGQVFYVFAMAGNPLIAAPMVASYCIVSVLLSRLLLGEKLTRAQTLSILPVLLGILLLGISEGLAG